MLVLGFKAFSNYFCSWRSSKHLYQYLTEPEKNCSEAASSWFLQPMAGSLVYLFFSAQWPYTVPNASQLCEIGKQFQNSSGSQNFIMYWE